MNTFVSLLRGINVSGKNLIKMTELKDLYISLGFENVETYIQSGNVIFSSSLGDELEISKLIEESIKKKFNFDVPTLTINQNKFQKIITDNPFAGKNPAHLYFTFLFETPVNIPNDKLRSAVKDDENFHLTGNIIYIYLPYGAGRTKLSNNFFENTLAFKSTSRNFRTVNKLAFDLLLD
jgi:uncharacterized protein (DUF1697 family)